MAKVELSEKALVMELSEECRRTSAAVGSLSVSQGRRSRPGTPKIFGSTERLTFGGLERPASAPPVGVRKDSTSSKAALVSCTTCICSCLFNWSVCWMGHSHSYELQMMSCDIT